MIPTLIGPQREVHDAVLAAQADADAAYDAASRASRLAHEWSARAGLSGEDAAEAVAAAARAKKEAEESRTAPTANAAWASARAAWAAASSAFEALERVSAEIKSALEA